MEIESFALKTEVHYLSNIVFAFDKKNLIFSEIHYGPRKRSQRKGNDPNDFVHGTIYRVKSEFLKKFESSFPRIFPNK